MVGAVSRMTTNAAKQHLFWLRLTGIAGIIGAVFWTFGDALIIGAHAEADDYPLLLGTHAGRISFDGLAMMLPSTEQRLAAGALVADMGIIFYLAGCWHLFQGLLPAGRVWAWIAFVLFICGNAWSPLGHAGFYYVGMVYKTMLNMPPAAHPAMLELGERFRHLLVIAWLMPITTLGLALVVLGVGIAGGNSAWPRWFALVANPVSLVAIGTAIAFISPEPLATWLGGAAFNLGFLVIYGLSTWLLWHDGRELMPSPP